VGERSERAEVLDKPKVSLEVLVEMIISTITLMLMQIFKFIMVEE
jgi:hypothetical protein